MMIHITRSVALLSLILLSACSGGSTISSSTPTVSSSATPTPVVSSSATPTPVVSSSATPTPVGSATTAPAGSAVANILVPTRGPASAGGAITALSTLVVQINSLNGAANLPSGVNAKTEYALANGQKCSNPAVCSVTIPAPVGTLNITVTAYAAANPVATETQTLTSTGNAGQSYTFALGGIVKSLNIGSLPNIITGQSAQLPLSFTVSDPSGALLLDTPFANPITLTDTDTSTSTGLQIAGSGNAPQSSVTITTPSTSVLFTYNGGPFSMPSSGQLFTYVTSTYTAVAL